MNDKIKMESLWRTSPTGTLALYLQYKEEYIKKIAEELGINMSDIFENEYQCIPPKQDGDD